MRRGASSRRGGRRVTLTRRPLFRCNPRITKYRSDHDTVWGSAVDPEPTPLPEMALHSDAEPKLNFDFDLVFNFSPSHGASHFELNEPPLKVRVLILPEIPSPGQSWEIPLYLGETNFRTGESETPGSIVVTMFATRHD
ncbi:hypothetical protein EVAR_42055_1 [Eumeta japonica]|uniref:Uncharacterized protein n=1 Tax=Eumeta variegata TaxID=151549 RepID=A0A4C1XT81_EUMVA|nr:hypothetical protein EVAR_42055_1 [Eumeta japonica]